MKRPGSLRATAIRSQACRDMGRLGDEGRGEVLFWRRFPMSEVSPPDSKNGN